MSWVVDTCIILDILDNHPIFGESSSLALQMKLDESLSIAPITYVELSPAFNGDVMAQDAFLDALWIRRDFQGNRDVVLAAHGAWHEHIQRKRAGESGKRPIADIMIGAYATRERGLITRNEKDFRRLYPSLAIFNPANLMWHEN